MTDQVVHSPPTKVRRRSVPRLIPLMGPITRSLLRARVPLGVNGLLTVPGRKTGTPRTTPLAIISYEGRRWIWSPWGDVQWVRNLRAAGQATVTFRGRSDRVRAVEQDDAGRLRFFREVMLPVARGIRFGRTFVRVVDGVDVEDPVGAAEGTAVFELVADD